MGKAPAQDETGSRAQATPGSEPAARVIAKGRKWVPHVFGKASTISKQQIRDITEMHESFTYNLKNRLSANLQLSTEIVSTSVDEQPYSEFTQNMNKESYLASLDMRPTHSQAILSLDASIALTMIDLLLGGNGKPDQVQRHITEIEERVLQIVLDMICEELQSAWRQFVEINFSFDSSHRSADLFRLMPAYEKILILNFEIRMTDLSGFLTLAFPATAASLLVKKLAKKSSQSKIGSPGSMDRLKEKLQECFFTVDVLLPPTRIKGRDLLSLCAGQTLMIQHALNQPAVVNVAGRKMFSAYPVRNGGQRGAVIHQTFPILFPYEKVSE